MKIGLEIKWGLDTPDELVEKLVALCERTGCTYYRNHKPYAKIEIAFPPYGDNTTNQILLDYLDFMGAFPEYPKYCRVHVNISGIPRDTPERLIPMINQLAYPERVADKDGYMKTWFKWKADHLEVRPFAISKGMESFYMMFNALLTEIQ
jgi:hypothetical protein